MSHAYAEQAAGGGVAHHPGLLVAGVVQIFPGVAPNREAVGNIRLKLQNKKRAETGGSHDENNGPHVAGTDKGDD